MTTNNLDAASCIEAVNLVKSMAETIAALRAETTATQSAKVAEAISRLLDEHSVDASGAGPGRQPVTWSQSFPDPATHPEQAKGWFLKTINAEREESRVWCELAGAILRDALIVVEAVNR